MNKRILLIEDDQWLAESYQSMLSARGYDVTHVASAHHAMQVIDTQPPDLLVADMMLGDHNSLTLFHELQSYSDTSSIPVVLCTGIDTAQFSRADMRTYGVVAVLDKATLTPDQLLLTVDEFLAEDKKVVR